MKKIILSLCAVLVLIGVALAADPRVAGIPVFPRTQTTITYAGTNNIDFAGAPYQLLTLAGDATVFTASNVSTGREVIVRLQISNSGKGSAITWPAWKFLGAAAPTGFAPAKVATLRLVSFGATAASNVNAILTIEP